MTARVIFINGYHRSGTTLVTSAATEASGGTTLTVGHLARHLPGLGRLLSQAEAGSTDRGVDRLAVTASTPEEYGWLLRHATGQPLFRAQEARSGILRDLVGELTRDGAPAVVLKNPWDTGRESLLLEHHPDASVLLVRRDLAAIEDSAERALCRYLTSHEYLRALTGDEEVQKLLNALRSPATRAVLLLLSRWRLRISVLRHAGRMSRLPLDRVAFLCYDELRQDPEAGAAWAAHVLDPEAFGRSFAARAFTEQAPARRSGWVVRAIDRYWARAWQRARTAQVTAGIVTPG